MRVVAANGCQALCEGGVWSLRCCNLQATRLALTCSLVTVDRSCRLYGMPWQRLSVRDARTHLESMMAHTRAHYRYPLPCRCLPVPTPALHAI